MKLKSLLKCDIMDVNTNVKGETARQEVELVSVCMGTKRHRVCIGSADGAEQAVKTERDCTLL